ncbi:MAG: ester cyclase [Chloroflexota bacterium]|nr:ester cyclase [Chloroflexota bacterium]
MNRKSAARFLVGLGILLGTMGSSAPVGLAQEATPAATCPAGTPEANVAVVRRFFEEGVNRGNLDVFDEVVTPNVVYAGATVGDESGLEALKRIYGEALTGLPGIQYGFLTSVASGDTVAVRYLVEGVHSGEFRGLEPTGNTITWNHSAFAHVACGQITEMWAEVNQLDRLRQFGTLAAEGPAARMAAAPAYPAATPEGASESASCAPQSPEDVLAVVDRLRAEVYNTGNIDILPEIVAEGYLHGAANGPDVVGIVAGGEQISGFLTALPDLEWTFDEAVVQGDQAAARWTIHGTHDGELLGFAATGNPVEYTGISFFTVQCGKIAEFQTEMDVAGLLEQVGAPVTREP